MNRKEKLLLAVILLLLFAIRLYHIDAAPLENEESWRQADTESIARNFVEYRFNILYPNFNYDGPLPNVPALELQVTTFIIAILYKFFGYHYFIARLIPIGFFLGSALYLYMFCRNHIGRRGAIFSLILYGIIPINVFYSRAIMPEPFALFSYIGGFHHFDKWLRNKRDEDLLCSSLLTMLAIMTKPMVIFISVPMLYLCFRHMGWKWLKSRRLWCYALLTLIVPFIYYWWSNSTAEFKFSSGLTRNLLFKHFIPSITKASTYKYFYETIPKAMTGWGIALLLGGLICTRKSQLAVAVWFAAMVLEVFVIVSVIKCYYYLVFFAVPCCILMGNALGRMSRQYFIRLLTIVLIILVGRESFHIIKPMYTINAVMEEQVRVVQNYIGKDTLLLAGSMDPCILSLSGRSGWRLNLSLNPTMSKYPRGTFDYYIKRGAKYFIPIRGNIYGDMDDKIMEFVNKEYKRLEPVKGYPIYELQ